MRGRLRKPPRLYLRKRDGRDGWWTILDGGKEMALGYTETERVKAEAALEKYIERAGRPLATRPEPGIGFIYFLSANFPDYPIKIGFSSHAVMRMSQLQTYCPYTIIILGMMSGTTRDERALHRRFARYHIRGEWFERAERLMHYIKETQSQTLIGSDAPD